MLSKYIYFFLQIDEYILFRQLVDSHGNNMAPTLLTAYKKAVLRLTPVPP